MKFRTPIHEALERFGRTTGCEKRHGAWLRTGTEVITVTSLDKSPYGPEYYIDQGFWPRSLSDGPPKRAYGCAIYNRAGGIIPQFSRRLDELLDLEQPIPDDERVTELVALLTKRLLPVLDEARSIDGLRNLVVSGPLRNSLITADGFEALGLPVPS